MSWTDYIMSSWSCLTQRESFLDIAILLSNALDKGWNLSNLSILVSGILQSSNETGSGIKTFSVSQAIHDHVDFITLELSAELLSSHMHFYVTLEDIFNSIYQNLCTNITSAKFNSFSKQDDQQRATWTYEKHYWQLPNTVAYEAEKCGGMKCI